MFGTDNAIEPIASAAVRARPVERRPLDEPPIREASSAEVARASRRRDAESLDRDRNPVRAADAPSRIAGLFRRRQVEPVQPDEVARRHGLYVTERRNTRIYFADYQQKQEVMRADPKRITTNQSDRQTVSAMLDLAESRGWQTVRLRGNSDFKREAWVQAQVRGIETEGHKATDTDRQEAARRKAALAPAPVEAARPTVASAAGKVQADQARPAAPVAVPVQAAAPPAAKPKAAKSAKAADGAGKTSAKIVTTNVAPAERARLRADFGASVEDARSAEAARAGPSANAAQTARPVEAAKPPPLSDQQVDRIRRDAETLGAVFAVVRDPNADPTRVREALEREPAADRQRLAAEVMAGLERRAAETGSRAELERIAPHLPGHEPAGSRVVIQPTTPPQRPPARTTSDELAAARAIPADVAAYDARIAAMTPEQREALGRAAHGSLYKPVQQAVAGGAPAAATPVAQDRQKAVWGGVEEAGKAAREAARAEAPAAKAGERAKAEAV